MDTPKTHSGKNCEYCDQILHGRSDQRFCNDTCRNSYNRKTRAMEKTPMHPNAKAIFDIIKKNYELLKQALPGTVQDGETRLLDEHVFFACGINTRYFTSTHTDKDGILWYCVFDRCYSVVHGSFVMVRDMPDQTDID